MILFKVKGVKIKDISKSTKRSIVRLTKKMTQFFKNFDNFSSTIQKQFLNILNIENKNIENKL